MTGFSRSDRRATHQWVDALGHRTTLLADVGGMLPGQASPIKRSEHYSSEPLLQKSGHMRALILGVDNSVDLRRDDMSIRIFLIAGRSETAYPRTTVRR